MAPLSSRPPASALSHTHTHTHTHTGDLLMDVKALTCINAPTHLIISRAEVDAHELGLLQPDASGRSEEPALVNPPPGIRRGAQTLPGQDSDVWAYLFNKAANSNLHSTLFSITAQPLFNILHLEVLSCDVTNVTV